MSVRLHVYKGVYVDAYIVREDGYFCESKIGLVEAKLKGKNSTPFSVSPSGNQYILRLKS